jgi:hypothetical protein
MPVPVCHVGLAYPEVQEPTVYVVDVSTVVFVEQLLFPPDPATILAFEASAPVQGTSSEIVVSVVLESFQVLSGIKPRALR